MSKPVTIYVESTPNPEVLKFVADIMVIDNGETVEFTSGSDAKGHSELAEALFNFPFVKSVYFAANFISITKTATIQWHYISQELRDYIQDWLANNDKAVQSVPEVQVQGSDLSEAPISTEPVINTELDKKIFELLEEYVRPAVEGDGGAIDFKSFDEASGTVTVVLKGACSGCPSSTATLKGGIESLLKTHMPEVQEVVALNG